MKMTDEIQRNTGLLKDVDNFGMREWFKARKGTQVRVIAIGDLSWFEGEVMEVGEDFVMLAGVRSTLGFPYRYLRQFTEGG